MRNRKLWFWTLVALLVLGVAMQWPTAMRVAVIANSLLLLSLIGSHMWRAFHE